MLSPVHIPRGFTKAYIAGKVVEDLGAKVARAHALFAGHDVLLIEGTGHAGVGAVIGLSNAVVAAKTPLSWASMAFAAVCCSGRSVP